mmetsp:Transcript_54015/g.161694  ORF Transcript_54015/g.161694 Transcript_54015/m.161694 type:complete len:230 (+) Transcript_54015:1121-1810(+)
MSDLGLRNRSVKSKRPERKPLDGGDSPPLTCFPFETSPSAPPLATLAAFAALVHATRLLVSPDLVRNQCTNMARAAYCEKTVAHAAPAAPPIHKLGLRTKIASPRKLIMAAARSTYRGDLRSCMPRHADWAVPITTAAGMPRARIRTYRSAAEKTAGSIASLPMSVLRRTRPRTDRVRPKPAPTRRPRRMAEITVRVVRGLAGSVLSVSWAADTRLVVAVYMKATRSPP